MGTRNNRLLTVAFGVGVTAMACLLSMIDSPVFDILLSIAGATLGLLLAVMLLGMLVPRANTIGVTCGLLAGLLAFALIRMVLPQLPEETLQKLGPFAGIAKNTWWDGLFSTMPALVVGIAVSYLTPPPGEEKLRGLLLKDRPQ